MQYALVMLLGPGGRETARARDLMESVLSREPTARRECHFIVVNDGNASIHELEPALVQFGAQTVVGNPLRGQTQNVYDRQAAGVLAGLHRVGQIDFAIKADTDAMCLGPFAERVQRYFHDRPGVGVVGTYLQEPDGRSRLWDFEEDWAPRVRRVHRKPLWRNAAIALLRRDPRGLQRYLRRRAVFGNALAHGYRYGYHIQGGSYAVSGEFLRRGVRYLADPLLFERSYLPCDVVLSLLVASTGLQLGAFNQPGDVFGIWFSRPTMTPQQLFEGGYGMVHAIKDADPEIERRLRAPLLPR